MRPYETQMIENAEKLERVKSPYEAIAETLFDYIRDIIYNTTNASLDINSLPIEFHNLAKGLNFLQNIVAETKTFTKELAMGNLNCDLPSRGNEIAAPLKTLHASLRHLTWQSQQVAIGDYTQKVNFMGEFSDAFNNMIEQLKQQRKISLDEKTTLKQYVEMILESTTNPLLIFDIEGKLVYISNSWYSYCDIFDSNTILKKEADEIFESIVIEDTLMEIKYQYMAAVTARQTIEIELDTYFNLHEEVKHFRMQFTPMLNAEGLVVGMMIFMFDLTESEQARRTAESARETAENSLRIKTTFLAKMSHEIRTPMNAILGITQTELQKRNLSPESVEAYEKIYDSSNNLLVLINDILDLSKIETGSIELNPKEYDTACFIHDTIQLNMMQIGSKPIKFILEINEDFPKSLYGDELRLKQVLNNLISNAIKYTEKGHVKLSIKSDVPPPFAVAEISDFLYLPSQGGTGGGCFSVGDAILRPDIHSDMGKSEISATEADSINASLRKSEISATDDRHSSLVNCQRSEPIFISFAIEDTGRGITDEDQMMLFTEYSRFNTKENRDAQGAGLGLNISKKLVELMGGNIQVQSEYQSGSTFTAVVLQNRINDEIIGSVVIEQLRNFTYKSKKHFENIQFTIEPMPEGKVLIVDDVETNLYVAKKLLTPYQLNIDTVISGFAAIDNITNGNVYDIIFMDHMMPEMDGIETTQKLREMGYKGTIVALTANALAGNDLIFLQNGFDDFVAKPIDTRILNKVLIKYITNNSVGNALVRSDIDLQTTSNLHIGTQNSLPNGGGTQNCDPYETDLDPKLLQIFSRDTKNAIITMQSSIKNDEIKLFTTNAHALKSMLASIGENDKSKQAADLEKAGLANVKNYIYENIDSFIKYLESLVEKIDLSLEIENSENTKENDEDINEDIEFLMTQLALIIEGCQNYDDTAVYEILDSFNDKPLKSNTKQAFEKIKDYLYLHSDFDSAEELARDLKESILN